MTFFSFSLRARPTEELTVARHLVGDNEMGFGVETADGQVQILRVEYGAKLGRLGGRLAGVGFDLAKVTDGSSLLPGLVFEAPIDAWGDVNAVSFEAVGRSVVLAK